MTSGYNQNKSKQAHSSLIRRDQDAHRDSDHPDNMTLDLVRDLKSVIQSKRRDDVQLTQSKVEAEVANLRRSADPDQCNFDQWKRTLPRDVQNCPNAVLRACMAYGNSPTEVKTVIQTKMNENDSDEEPTETSLDNITNSLRKLKRDLDQNKSPNLFQTVRSVKENQIDRAHRLFYSEAHHFARGLKDFVFADAKNAVQAIRETDYETNDPKVLLCIIKTGQDADGIRDYIQQQQPKTTHRNDSPERHSISSEDESSPPIINSSKPNIKPNTDDTSTFHYKPLDNPYLSKPPATTSRRFENRSQNEFPDSFRQPQRPPRK